MPGNGVSIDSIRIITTGLPESIRFARKFRPVHGLGECTVEEAIPT
jgi:hypothetical protein